MFNQFKDISELKKGDVIEGYSSFRYELIELKYERLKGKNILNEVITANVESGELITITAYKNKCFILIPKQDAENKIKN